MQVFSLISSEQCCVVLTSTGSFSCRERNGASIPLLLTGLQAPAICRPTGGDTGCSWTEFAISTGAQCGRTRIFSFPNSSPSLPLTAMLLCPTALPSPPISLPPPHCSCVNPTQAPELQHLPASLQLRY